MFVVHPLDEITTSAYVKPLINISDAVAFDDGVDGTGPVVLTEGTSGQTFTLSADLPSNGFKLRLVVLYDANFRDWQGANSVAK